MQYGLLGEKLGHSFSPEIHNQLGNYPYQLFEIHPEDLSSFLQSKTFAGMNVTIPYKKTVIPYCHHLTPEAEMLQAVNTIVRNPDGTLTGHNTDYFGFSSMVERAKLSLSGKKALVLGSGGASNTVCAVLRQQNANVIVVSRTGENNYSNLQQHSDAKLIVNTTPVGMYPYNGQSPIDLTVFPHLECVMDLIYNPLKTKLLIDADALGIPAYNGLWMLVAQAKESAEWFTGTQIDISYIPEIYQKLLKKSQNIILIGMPGCGKTTVAKILAEKTGRGIVDTDQLIEEKTGCSIPDIFSSDGENYFRRLETEVICEFGKRNSIIMSTGGGCVTQRENLDLLRQNGTVIWIKRDLSLLETKGRPLSENGKLQQMYTQREPLYHLFADLSVDNNYSPEETAEQIIKKLKLDVII